MRKVKSCLNNHGLTVYCDWTSDNDFLKRDLVSDYTKMVLKKRIEQSKSIVFLQTNNTVNAKGLLSSPWVLMEIEYALSIGKPVYSLNFSNINELFEKINFEIDGDVEISSDEISKIHT